MPIVNRDMDNEFELLAAAAPELLEALKEFAYIDTSTPSDLWAIDADRCKRARAAIAKAEGK